MAARIVATKQDHDELWTGRSQWVCTVCGYNMIEGKPHVCPFCGAGQDAFADWRTAERMYRVTPVRVNAYVTQLLSVPRLGFEHAAYRVETEQGAVWIDCPSAFNRDLPPADAVYFTHRDFLGASNLYRDYWGIRTHLHALDAEHPLAVPFRTDTKFDGDFTAHGIAAFHIGGHTPGFTVYVYREVLFVCDYAFPPGAGMRFNPNGPQQDIRAAAVRLLDVMERHRLQTVCGYHFVTDFDGYLRDFKRLMN